MLEWVLQQQQPNPQQIMAKAIISGYTAEDIENLSDHRVNKLAKEIQANKQEAGNVSFACCSNALERRLALLELRGLYEEQQKAEKQMRAVEKQLKTKQCCEDARTALPRLAAANMWFEATIKNRQQTIDSFDAAFHKYGVAYAIRHYAEDAKRAELYVNFLVKIQKFINDNELTWHERHEALKRQYDYTIERIMTTTDADNLLGLQTEAKVIKVVLNDIMSGKYDNDTLAFGFSSFLF